MNENIRLYDVLATQMLGRHTSLSHITGLITL